MKDNKSQKGSNFLHDNIFLCFFGTTYLLTEKKILL